MKQKGILYDSKINHKRTQSQWYHDDTQHYKEVLKMTINLTISIILALLEAALVVEIYHGVKGE